MGLKRRTFLQMGTALLALGVSETALTLIQEQSWAAPLLDGHYQALAQSSGRKLALLIGINQYSGSNPLTGCVTDVELQRELLMYRFGFQPSNILTLTDKEATRQNIETAFIEHLSNQAVAGDVVVFHFSGYGSRININADSSLSTASSSQNSLLPVDALLGIKEIAATNNLLAETLFLLLRSLSTEQVTTILDTSYTDAVSSWQGNLRIRSQPSIVAARISNDALFFQEQLLSRLGISQKQLPKQIPGILMAAAKTEQPAMETTWGGFSAGMFTYALTQLLWQITPPPTIQISMNRAAQVIGQLIGKDQQPQLQGQNSSKSSLLTYHLFPQLPIGADGVVTAVEDNGKTVILWLGGIPAQVLAYYSVNSLFNIVTSEVVATVQIRSKEGLIAKARIINAAESYIPQIGQLVQESMRIVPRHIGLTIALDTYLERIERVDATSAFANIAGVSSVVISGEQPADYLFGKAPQQISEKKNLVLDLGGIYRLFYIDGTPLPSTNGEVGEAVKVAVNRLLPKLKTLLAAKLWKLTANEGSSKLGVTASLSIISPTIQLLMQRSTIRSQGFTSSPSKQGIPIVPLGSHIQYQIQNYSPQSVYLMLLGLDSSGNAIAFYPLESALMVNNNETKPIIKEVVIPAGANLTIPRSTATLEWVVQGAIGLAEMQLIFANKPFTQTIAALEAARHIQVERVSELLNPLDVARSLWQDLHQASNLSVDGMATDTYALDVNNWATLSFIYQVV